MGETSAVAVRALSLGKPLVVSDVGSFSELPDSVALKVPVGEREVTELAGALDLLAAEPERREAMGRAARQLADHEHSLEAVADAYAAALREAVAEEDSRRRVVAEASRA
jgi:glycosyltransferase involved in cell wall biosynthesis